MDADAIVYGAATMSSFSKGWVENLPAATTTYPREDFIAPCTATKFYIVINTKCTLAYDSNIIERKGRSPHGVIHVLLENASDDYLEYLRSKGISYIFCGKDKLDPVIMMQKAYSLFNIKKALICGGAYADWTLLSAGLIDEVQTVIIPVADGDPTSHSVFRRSEGMESHPVPFQLVHVEKVENDGLLTIYKPKNALPND